MSVYCQAAGGCSKLAANKLTVTYQWPVSDMYPDGLRRETWLVCNDHIYTEGGDSRELRRETERTPR